MSKQNKVPQSLLSLRNDAVFKMFFSKKENEEQLRGFLKAMINFTDEDLAFVEVKNPTLTKESVGDKDFIVDVRIVSATGHRLNMEMQMQNHDGFIDRMTSYNARQYASQLKRGEGYAKLKASISIVVTNFELFDDTDEAYEFITYRRRNGKIFTDAQQFHILDLTKLPKKLRSDYHIWGALFKVRSSEELKKIMTKSEEMKQAGEKLLQLSADEEAREIARAREESQWAWQHTLYHTEERARKEGHVEGQQAGSYEKAIEVAMKMIERGDSLADIFELTDLPMDTIEKLEKSIWGEKNV